MRLHVLCVWHTVLHMTNTPAIQGQALRVMRVAQGLTLRELAEKAGVNHAYLSQVERGDKTPNPRWLRSVTDALADNLKGAA